MSSGSTIPPEEPEIEVGKQDEDECDEIPIQDLSLLDVPAQAPATAMGSASLYQNILKKFGELGTQMDLLKLRQLGDESYKTLNPIFMESIGNTMTLGPFLNCLCRSSYFNNSRWKTKELYWVNIGSVPNFVDDSYDEQEDEFYKKSVNFRHSGDIYIKNWNPEKAWTFRTLVLDHGFQQMLFDHPQIDKIIGDISPYITSIYIPSPPPKYLGRYRYHEFGQFLNYFPNLRNITFEKLNVRPWGYHYDIESEEIMTIDELKNMLETLESKPEIKLHVSDLHEEILTKLGSIENVKFNLKIDQWIFRREIGDDPVGLFKRISEQFENIMEKITMFDLVVFCREDRLDNMKTLVTLCLKHKKQIGNLELWIDDKGIARNEEEDMAFTTCIVQLYPVLTRKEHFNRDRE